MLFLGAVFREGSKPEIGPKKVKTNELIKQLSDIKISSCITGEQIEAEERSKKVRKLKKVLREIEALEGRSGQLEKEQAEKLNRKQAICEEIDELEAL